MRINKKAVMEDFMQLIAWSIVILVAFFIFMGVKTANTITLMDSTKDIQKSIDGIYLLTDFLKQETENPETENMAETIVLYAETKDSQLFAEINEKANEHFSKVFASTTETSWNFKIYDNKMLEITEISPVLVPLTSIKSEKTVSSAILPLRNKQGSYITVEVNLIEWVLTA